MLPRRPSSRSWSRAITSFGLLFKRRACGPRAAWAGPAERSFSGAPRSGKLIRRRRHRVGRPSEWRSVAGRSPCARGGKARPSCTRERECKPSGSCPNTGGRQRRHEGQACPPARSGSKLRNDADSAKEDPHGAQTQVPRRIQIGGHRPLRYQAAGEAIAPDHVQAALPYPRSLTAPQTRTTSTQHRAARDLARRRSCLVVHLRSFRRSPAPSCAAYRAPSRGGRTGSPTSCTAAAGAAAARRGHWIRSSAIAVVGLAGAVAAEERLQRLQAA
jgi:hypothetical protein